MVDYYRVAYDNEASGPFVAEGALVTWNAGADTGFIVTVIDQGTTGFLEFMLTPGDTPPIDNDTMTQGSTTADAVGAAVLMLYPAYQRQDMAVSALGAFTWTGPALGVSHSFRFDGQTSNAVVGEILTFSPGGEQCEIVTIESDVGVSGEYSVRWITPIDISMPADNDTFTGDIAGDGTLDGEVHERAYSALHNHRFASALNSDPTFEGDDIVTSYKPIRTGKDTVEIVNMLGDATITDEISQHMYGGSISQASDATLYSGLNVQVTTPLATTQPILIQDDAIVTDYWKNAFMPHSIDGNVRIMLPTRKDGVDIDGKRIRGKLHEFGEIYFLGGTTLSTGKIALALFSSPDGNNNTAVGTVAGAPYNSITLVEGFQTIDYNNGNGATPYGYSVGFGTANSLQTYERLKYNQRRGTSELMNGRNAQLFTGINLNFAYDGEAGGPFTEDEKIAWGTIITYSGQTTNLTLGEVVQFVGTGALGRLIYMDDNGATGTLIFDMEPGITPLATDTLLGVTSGGDGDVDIVTFSSIAGTAILVALDDQGTTGNLYCQIVTGLTPLDNQKVFGSSSNANADVDGTPATRVINNQFIGSYTGSNYQTNFGMAIASANAIVGDLLRNLLGVQQGPPDNQVGAVNLLVIGDFISSLPWDGSSLDPVGDPEPDFDEMALDTALTGASTQVDVGTGNIPDNTPQVGGLLVERDSDGELDFIEYDSHDGDAIFEIIGTAPGAAAIANTVMRAPIYKTAEATTESFTAVKGAGNTQFVVKVTLGGGTPIKPNIQTTTFGAAGFDVNASRIPD